MANIITGLRIVISAVLLFCPALSPAFYTLYVLAGITDMIDGAVARKTNTVSEFGSKLDTSADIIFVTVCLIKLFPVLAISTRLSLWILVIAIIKLFNIAAGYFRQKKFIVVHSVLNKITGGLLFVFPLTLSVVDPNYSVPAICLAATAAAVQEGYSIITMTSSLL